MLTKPTIVAVLGGWRATAFALLALCALTWGGIQTARLKYQEGRTAKWAAESARVQIEGELKRALLAEELAALKARAPKAGKTVREVVHANPTDCVVPAAPSLRDAVREANAARSGT